MSQYADRIAELHERACRDERAFEPPAEPPAEEEAMGYLREGFGEALAVYLDARTGGPPVRFETGEFDRLQGAMNTWLSLYTRCHGVELDAAFTVRTAAEVFVDTHDLKGTAAVLTHVPGRESPGRASGTPAGSRAPGSGSADSEADPDPTPADG